MQRMDSQVGSAWLARGLTSQLIKRRGIQRPTNRAFPGTCSRNEVIPIFWSSVANRGANSSLSRSAAVQTQL